MAAMQAQSGGGVRLLQCLTPFKLYFTPDAASSERHDATLSMTVRQPMWLDEVFRARVRIHSLSFVNAPAATPPSRMDHKVSLFQIAGGVRCCHGPMFGFDTSHRTQTFKPDFIDMASC